MPELPEVQTIVDGLNEKIAGAVIAGVWSDWKKMVIQPKKWEDFEELLLEKSNRRKIKNIKRAGKFIVFELEGNLDLIAHLRMTGHFLVIGDDKRKNKDDSIYDKTNGYIHFKLFLEDGREAALSDLRKFGKIYLVESHKVESLLNVGVDPLDKGFDLNSFLGIIKNKKGNIKQVLMDQSLIAGIGNIYSSEILWEAEISPLRKVESLSGGEFEKIHKAIVKVLKYAIKMRGDSESDYRDVDGKEGGYQKVQRVYQREGQKCYRCGGVIQRVKIGQRSGFWCQRCQK